MEFNLVNHRNDAGFINKLLQMVGLEVTDADTLNQPLLLQLNHPFPGLDIVIDCRNRPVHQIEIDIVELKLLQALFKGLGRAFLIVIPQLGGDE